MINFLYDNPSIIFVPISLFVGMGFSWMYLGLRARARHTFWYRLPLAGIALFIIGLLLFSCMLLLDFHVSGTILNRWTLAFVVLTVFTSLVFGVLSLFFSRRTIRWEPPRNRTAVYLFIIIGIAVAIFNILAGSSGQRPWIIAYLIVSPIYLASFFLFLFLARKSAWIHFSGSISLLVWSLWQPAHCAQFLGDARQPFKS